MSVLSKPLQADHLLTIFSRVSLPTFLRLPLVCAHWATLQPPSGGQIHTLTLRILEKRDTPLDSAEDWSSIAKSQFTLFSPILGLSLSTLIITHQNGTLPQAIAHTLLSLFPAIRSLNLENLAFNHPNKNLPVEESISGLASLFQGWSSSLHRLGLYGFTQVPKHIRDDQNRFLQYDHCACVSSLLSIINTLPQLRHLLIDVSNTFQASKHFYDNTILPTTGPASLHLPILTRLQSFSFNSVDPLRILLPSLQAYATRTDSLPVLRLGPDSDELIACLVAAKSLLLDAITHCDLSYCERTSPVGAPLIGAPLRNLTFLTLYTHQVRLPTLRRLFQYLSTCRRLTTLEFALAEVEDVREGDVIPEIASLPSVKTFTFHFGPLISHRFFTQQLPVARHFPELTTFKVNFLPKVCPECAVDHGILINSITDEQQIARRNCLHSSLASLRVCDKLEKIVISHYTESNTSDLCEQTSEEIDIEELKGIEI